MNLGGRLWLLGELGSFQSRRRSYHDEVLNSFRARYAIAWQVSGILFGFLSLAGQCDDLYESRYVNDCLVHSILSANGRHQVPVVMVPGLNLSSYIYLTTPDGRQGWAQHFAEDGYDVHVINDPDFDFAKGGFSVAPFIVPTSGRPALDPGSSQGWQRDIWQRWGFGSSAGVPYSNARFPTGLFASFSANYPYVGTSPESYSGGIISLLEDIGPALLMAHSAGGPQAVSAALQRPDLVKGFIMVEPTNPPDASDFPTLAGMSMLGVYADQVVSRNQTGRKAGTEAAALLFASNGGVGEVISLPDDLGIFGNSHLMMQDNNSEFIADLIMDWLSEHVDTGSTPHPVTIIQNPGSITFRSPVMGIWQSSLDLSDWTDLSQVESRELTVSPSGSVFYRQRD